MEKNVSLGKLQCHHFQDRTLHACFLLFFHCKNGTLFIPCAAYL